jgi:hypothetical protein
MHRCEKYRKPNAELFDAKNYVTRVRHTPRSPEPRDKEEKIPVARGKVVQVVLAVFLIGLGFQLAVISSKGSVSSLALGVEETGAMRLESGGGVTVYRYFHFFSDPADLFYWSERDLLLFIEVRNASFSQSSADPSVMVVDGQDRAVFTGHFRPEEREVGVRFAFNGYLIQNGSYAAYVINPTPKPVIVKVVVYPIVQTYRIDLPYVWEGVAIIAVGLVCLWLTAKT